MQALVHGCESVVAITQPRFRKRIFTSTKALFQTYCRLRFRKRIFALFKIVVPFASDLFFQQKVHSSPRENCKSRKKEPMIVFVFSWHFFFLPKEDHGIWTTRAHHDIKHMMIFFSYQCCCYFYCRHGSILLRHVRPHYDNAHVGDDFCAGVGWDSRLCW